MLWSELRLILKTSSVTPDFFYVFYRILSFSTENASSKQASPRRSHSCTRIKERCSCCSEFSCRRNAQHLSAISVERHSPISNGPLLHALNGKKCNRFRFHCSLAVLTPSRHASGTELRPREGTKTECLAKKQTF